MNGGAVTDALSNTQVTDAHTAGAAGEIAGATTVQFAFPNHSVDPVQRIDAAAAAVLRALGEAALQMIAHPDSQAVATAAVVAATAAPAKLAVDDGLRAEAVADHPPPFAAIGHDPGFLFG